MRDPCRRDLVDMITTLVEEILTERYHEAEVESGLLSRGFRPTEAKTLAIVLVTAVDVVEDLVLAIEAGETLLGKEEEG